MRDVSKTARLLSAGHDRTAQQLDRQLRAKLSHACVDALQPDLIIMDEFQRFRNLLHGDDDAAFLARELFDYPGENGNPARTLLLSATPYRMLTLTGDAADEGDHYKEFLETVSFLYGRERGLTVSANLEAEMRAFRGFLQSLPAARDQAVEARKLIEQKLRHVIARTERVSSTVARDSMMTEPLLTARIEPADLGQAAAVSRVARALDAPEIVEYWKSAPYLLNFMRHYSLKRLLLAKKDKPSGGLLEAVRDARSAMLDHAAIDGYAPLEPANGRMRSLIDDVFSGELEKRLWIPASMPYYGKARLDPPMTKGLVFSSWSMVPDAIAALLSYEAERRMGVGESGRRYFEQQRLRPLQFRQDQGRLAGLRALLLIYPSPTLAEIGDPLAAVAKSASLMTTEEMRAAIAQQLAPALDAVRLAAPEEDGSPIAEWAVPAIIDGLRGTRSGAWLSAGNGLAALADEEGFKEHVRELAGTAGSGVSGIVSDDLADLLVDVALGSPAVCALRALRRIAPDLAWDDPGLLSAASRVAWAFRTLYNQHDAIALLRQGSDDRYWHRALTYGVDHNLQSVLDEYAHHLVDSEGLRSSSPERRVAGIAEKMASAISIRPSQIEFDDLSVADETIRLETHKMRGRFAMRLADYTDEEGTAARLGGVRDAFNSPFKPFVLATTSVGQEGLDFHPYCYRVYHWNLPGNPVDLEQREGRVHRFKNHAVRLNLAERQVTAIRGSDAAPHDPWARMFEQARAETSVDTDLIPYWIYEGTVKVERRVLSLPFSKEIKRLEWLKRSLTLYRLAFGQPRQDDLIAYLDTLARNGYDAAHLSDLQIRLEPLVAAAS